MISKVIAVDKKIIITDIILIAIVAVLPILSHLSGIQFYYFEPFRISIFASLIFLNKNNAYLLAILLPFISFLIFGHPILIKTALISYELLTNVLIYTLIIKYINIFWSTFISVSISKLFYYSLKYLVIASGLMTGGLFGYSLFIQLLFAVLFSLVVWQVGKRNN